MNSRKYIDVLKQYWGYDSFRGIQEEIITSIGEGHDTLGLMPTGGGKSICFQVPALTMDGLCIVITPLIALMKDQVFQLKMRGIRADAVYAGMSREDIIRVLDNACLGGLKFLYVSPERLYTELFIAKLQRMQHICMLVVDEAHCVSQWGYDFRPSYLRISEIRNIVPYVVPMLALTATATLDVIEDIQNQLAFREKRVFRMSFERKNLIYVVRETKNRLEEMLHIIRSIPNGSVIVYVRNRKETASIAQHLTIQGISAINYHAGLTSAEKDFRQTLWTKDRIRVMVATNAFGMGIDKPDVRLVIHFNSPDSIEAYFQEAGRAGRDGQTSYAVLLFDRTDPGTLRKRIKQTYPEQDYVKRTYEDVCCFLGVGVGEAEGRTFDFSRKKFCVFFQHFEGLADSALKLLTNAGYIEYCDEREFKSALQFILKKEELYQQKGQSEDEDALMSAVLRSYPGIFSKFVYIEETFLAHIIDSTPEKVYEILKTWNRNRIVNYIPHRNTPTITFTMPRVETKQIALMPSVYSDRKEDYSRRIEKMIEYAVSTEKCRSRQLLEYFGEKNACNCGRCDVCFDKKKSQNAKSEAFSSIANLLSDGKVHKMQEITSLPFELSHIDEAIYEMLAEEMIISDGITIWKKAT